jgi:hypothetical protein
MVALRAVGGEDQNVDSRFREKLHRLVREATGVTIQEEQESFASELMRVRLAVMRQLVDQNMAEE